MTKTVSGNFPAFLKRIRLTSNGGSVIFEQGFPGKGIELNAISGKNVFIGGNAIKSQSRWRQSTRFCRPQTSIAYQVAADVKFNEAMIPTSPTKGPLAIKELSREFEPIILGATATKSGATAILDVPMQWTEPDFGRFKKIRLDSQYDIKISCRKSIVTFKTLFVGSNAGRFEAKIRSALTGKLKSMAGPIAAATKISTYGGCSTNYKVVPFKSSGPQFGKDYSPSARSCL